MKKLFTVPVPSIKWKTIDLRRYYYVSIGNELTSWWAIEGEIKDIDARYGDLGVKFKRIPLWKTIFR